MRIAPQELPLDQMAGEDLPSPRKISNKIHDQPETQKQNPYGLSSFMWAIGQFMDHTMGSKYFTRFWILCNKIHQKFETELLFFSYFAAETEFGGQEFVEFCTHFSCSKPIKVPDNDPTFSPFGT